MRQTIIPNFPDYRISENGTIFCLSRSKILNPFLSGSGYWAINLKQGCFRGFKYIHRLVLESFIGPCPEGLEARHLDGNRDHNHLHNLCWGTPKENAGDRKRIKKYFDATLKIFRKVI